MNQEVVIFYNLKKFSCAEKYALVRHARSESKIYNRIMSKDLIEQIMLE